MKRRMLWIAAAVLLAAAVSTIGLMVRHRQTVSGIAGAVLLKTGGRTVQIPIGDLDRTAFSGETVNGKGERFTHDCRGVPLKILLDTADCAVGVSAANLILDSLREFADEHESHILRRRCVECAARTAVRLNARSVHVFTRKRDDYTALENEIEAAMQEGVRAVWLQPQIAAECDRFGFVQTEHSSNYPYRFLCDTLIPS